MAKKLLFVGAGAIGSYLGAFLSRAGHDVTLVDPWAEQVETIQRDGAAGTRHMMVRDPDCYIFAPAGGLFEPCDLAGAEVYAGDRAGWLHFVEDVDRPPIEVHHRRSGLVWMASGPGRVQRGDVVCVVMNDYDDAAASMQAHP